MRDQWHRQMDDFDWASYFDLDKRYEQVKISIQDIALYMELQRQYKLLSQDARFKETEKNFHDRYLEQFKLIFKSTRPSELLGIQAGCGTSRMADDSAPPPSAPPPSAPTPALASLAPVITPGGSLGSDSLGARAPRLNALDSFGRDIPEVTTVHELRRRTPSPPLTDDQIKLERASCIEKAIRRALQENSLSFDPMTFELKLTPEELRNILLETPNITHLDLTHSYYQGTELPDLSQMRNLTHVIAVGFGLTTMGQLPIAQLQKLDLSQNALTQMPSTEAMDVGGRIILSGNAVPLDIPRDPPPDRITISMDIGPEQYNAYASNTTMPLPPGILASDRTPTLIYRSPTGFGTIYLGGSRSVEVIAGPKSQTLVDGKRVVVFNCANDVTPEHLAIDPTQVTVFHLGLPDDGSLFDFVSQAKEIVDFLNQGFVVVINCRKGVSRSASVTIATLMELGMTYKQAHDHISILRPIIQPHKDFVKQLKAIEREPND